MTNQYKHGPLQLDVSRTKIPFFQGSINISDSPNLSQTSHRALYMPSVSPNIILADLFVFSVMIKTDAYFTKWRRRMRTCTQSHLPTARVYFPEVSTFMRKFGSVLIVSQPLLSHSRNSAVLRAKLLNCCNSIYLSAPCSVEPGCARSHRCIGRSR